MPVTEIRVYQVDSSEPQVLDRISYHIRRYIGLPTEKKPASNEEVCARRLEAIEFLKKHFPRTVKSNESLKA